MKEKKEKKYQRILPGTPAVRIISAENAGIGVRILEEIAHPVNARQDNERDFGPWKNGECEGTISFKRGAAKEEQILTFDVVLKLGSEEGLHITEESGLSYSLKDKPKRKGKFSLVVGKNLPSWRLSDIANQIVGTWIIHGFHWRDRAGNECNWPYGNDEDRPVSFNFSVIDGSADRLTLHDLLELGCIRSTHVGQWNKPYAIIPAVAGMPVLLHEFKKTSEDISEFCGLHIGKDAHNIWGGYVTWNGAKDKLLENKEFGDIACCTSSPFSFHLHATRKRFPNCTLASTFLLRSLGEEDIQRVLRLVSNLEPERIYRLIDENGITHSLKKVTDEDLVFDGGMCYPKKDAWKNIFSTFKDMETLEENPLYELRRERRLVLDSHFYVVVFGIASAKEGESYHLSGSEMYSYLVEDKQNEYAHKIRNERLFKLVQDALNVAKINFHIFPGIKVPEKFGNQYTFEDTGNNLDFLSLPVAANL